MQTAHALEPQTGAVAELVTRYVSRRGISKAKLAQRTGTYPKVIAAVMRGIYDNGTEALGLRFRPDGERLIVAIARELDIPSADLDAAIIADIRRAAGPLLDSPSIQGRYLHEQSFVGFLPPAGNIIPIEAARQRRRSLRLAPRRDSVAQ